MVMGVIQHLHDVAVAAAGHKAQKGRFQIRVGEVEGRDMPPQMVHRDEGLLSRIGKALGEVHPHQHRADEPRRKGDGNAVQVRGGQLCLVQRGLHRGADVLDVAAAGNFRHNAAVKRLFRHAGGHHVADELSPVLHHRGGGLVAGALDS